MFVLFLTCLSVFLLCLVLFLFRSVPLCVCMCSSVFELLFFCCGSITFYVRLLDYSILLKARHFSINSWIDHFASSWIYKRLFLSSPKDIAPQDKSGSIWHGAVRLYASPVSLLSPAMRIHRQYYVFYDVVIWLGRGRVWAGDLLLCPHSTIWATALDEFFLSTLVCIFISMFSLSSIRLSFMQYSNCQFCLSAFLPFFTFISDTFHLCGSSYVTVLLVYLIVFSVCPFFSFLSLLDLLFSFFHNLLPKTIIEFVQPFFSLCLYVLFSHELWKHYFN